MSVKKSMSEKFNAEKNKAKKEKETREREALKKTADSKAKKAYCASDEEAQSEPSEAQSEPSDSTEQSETEKNATKKPKATRDNKKLAFYGRIEYAANLMLAQKHLENDIITLVNAKFPDYPGKKFDKKECCRTRWMLKHNAVPGIAKDAAHYERMIEREGKLFNRLEAPKAKRAQKFTEENDPLANIAGINVHEKAETPKVKKVKKEKVSE